MWDYFLTELKSPVQLRSRPTSFSLEQNLVDLQTEVNPSLNYDASNEYEYCNAIGMCMCLWKAFYNMCGSLLLDKDKSLYVPLEMHVLSCLLIKIVSEWMVITNMSTTT